MTQQTVEQLARALKPYVLAWIGDATGSSGGASTQLHILATNTALGPLHNISGVTPDSFLVANVTGNDALMRIIAISDLPAHTSTHSHVDLVGVSANQHHAQSHVIANTAGLGADHTTSGLSVGQVLRATGATSAAFAALIAADLPIHTHDHDVDLTNVSSDDHHNQSHVLATASGLGVDHTVSGLTTGQVLRATGAATAAFQALIAADLPTHTHDHDVDLTGVSSDDHHAQSHVLATISGLGADHSVSGLTVGQVLKATSPTAAAFGALISADLPTHTHDHDVDLTGISSDDHHDQSHVLISGSGLGADHTISGETIGTFLRVTGAATAALQLIATGDLPALPTPGTLSITSANAGAGAHTHVVTASSNPGGAAAILASASDGGLQLLRFAVGVDPSVDGQVHLYEDSSSIVPKLKIEQDGIGDAAINFLLTGGQAYSIGIDHSRVGDPLMISPGANVSSSVAIRFSAAGGLSIGDASQGAGAGSLRVADYITVLGGLHVGGVSDPGTDNLLVDGNSQFVGETIIPFKGFTAANGDNNNIDVTGMTNILITGPTAAFTITGISGGVDGREVLILNLTSFDMTIAHEDTASSASNRITTLIGTDQTKTAQSLAGLKYEEGLSRWVLSGFAG